MGFKVVSLKNGWQRAKISKIEEVDTKFGRANEVTFSLQDGIILTSLFPIKASPKSKSMKLLRACNIEITENEVKNEELIGKEILIYISVDETGKTKITDLAPVGEKSEFRKNLEQQLKDLIEKGVLTLEQVLSKANSKSLEEIKDDVLFNIIISSLKEQKKEEDAS